MRAALTIARKDLLQRLRDRSAYVIAFLAPFGLIAILSLTLADVDDEGGGFEATYAVADEDGGEVAAGFSELLGGLDFATVREVGSVREAVDLVEDGEADAAFGLPQGLTGSVQAGRGGRILVTVEPQAGIAGLVARSLATSYASELDAIGVSVATVLGADGDPARAADVAERAHSVPAAASLERRAAGGGRFSSTTFYAAGMAVFFVFFTVEFGVRSLLEERQGGTLARLLVAPLRPSAVIAGKATASFLVGLVSMAALVVASGVLLGAEWGDPMGVGLLVLAGVLAAMGATALVATLARTAAQAGSYASILAVVLGLLGGTFFPVSQGPGLLATVSLATPHAWLMRGFQDVATGAGPLEILPPLGAVLAFAVLTGGIALRRAGRLVPR